MAVFPDLQMLVLAQSSGSLTALPMPTPHNGAVAAPGRAATFAAVGVPASRSLPLGGGALPSGPGMPALHTWLPRVAQIKAHKNGIETATSLVSCCRLFSWIWWSSQMLQEGVQYGYRVACSVLGKPVTGHTRLCLVAWLVEQHTVPCVSWLCSVVSCTPPVDQLLHVYFDRLPSAG
jgi:hypothetical protein